MEEFFSAGIANPELFERIYSQYQLHPKNVDPTWQKIFTQLSLSEKKDTPQEDISCKQLRVAKLVDAYRTYGFLFAKVNPMSPFPPKIPESLQLSSLGVKEEEVAEILSSLQKMYCGAIGYEYMGMRDKEFENWMQSKIEKEASPLTREQKERILQYLIQAELLETFIQTKYTGQTRFSLEGAETVIPMLAEFIEVAGKHGIKEIILGMAHRGRLNVLGNIMKKPYAEILSEFEVDYLPESSALSGDVKYHKGYSSQVTTSSQIPIFIQLTANPSHLESVDPIIEGQARAKNQLYDNKRSVLPLLFHGDASLSGQGVIYETMQLSELAGYTVGGTIHIVINNQIGFTTLSSDSRSTHECTDIAKTFGAPVFHVSAEEPEKCVQVIIFAMEIRKKFQCDVFINLYCYRKYGHNEGDEPTFTQPLEYQLIREKQTVREMYRNQILSEGTFEKKFIEDFESNFKKILKDALEQSKGLLKDAGKVESAVSSRMLDYFSIQDTGIPTLQLESLTASISSIPENFHVHPKIKQLIQDRLSMVKGEKNVDWGMAETLAISSLLKEGITVRFVGQDSSRGTFSHRHGIWVDQKNGEFYYPLSHLQTGQGKFELINSPLSEYAALAFEYGFCLSFPQALVIWEAQYGDFCNGAQIVIDQYISSGEQKWNYHVPLVLLLPHGYEGQGPEHSSARMERFLALAGNENMVIANPSTSLQYFHLLRRHMLCPLGKPLIIFTPKALLRNKESGQPIQTFTQGCFQTIIHDPMPPKNASRLVFCSGKIYYELVRERSLAKVDDLEITRIEQLYPLDIQSIHSILKKADFQEYFWVQEEPRNMGAWPSLYFLIQPLLPKGKELKFVGRERSASPAAGYYELHKREYATLIKTIFA